MTISELIKKLEEVKKEFGDLIVVRADFEADEWDISDVWTYDTDKPESFIPDTLQPRCIIS